MDCPLLNQIIATVLEYELVIANSLKPAVYYMIL